MERQEPSYIPPSKETEKRWLKMNARQAGYAASIPTWGGASTSSK